MKKHYNSRDLNGVDEMSDPLPTTMGIATTKIGPTFWLLRAYHIGGSAQAKICTLTAYPTLHEYQARLDALLADNAAIDAGMEPPSHVKCVQMTTSNKSYTARPLASSNHTDGVTYAKRFAIEGWEISDNPIRIYSE